MSLLNLPNDGLPQILVLLHSALLQSKKPLSKDELLKRVAPENVVDDAGLARNTLLRWTELGLFADNDGQIDLVQRPTSVPSDLAASTKLTRRTACRLALAPDNNTDLWAVRGARAADLSRSLAWMLAQDVYRASYKNFSETESEQIKNADLQIMRNDVRRNGLRVWARFLGFSLVPFADIDPTLAVRDILPEILGQDAGLPAAEFVERLSAALPVLDSGHYQIQVLQQLEKGALSERRPGLLSTALSRSLWNLRACGELTLERRADLGSAITLSGAAGERADETYHWIGRPSVGSFR